MLMLTLNTKRRRILRMKRTQSLYSHINDKDRAEMARKFEREIYNKAKQKEPHPDSLEIQKLLQEALASPEIVAILHN